MNHELREELDHAKDRQPRTCSYSYTATYDTVMPVVDMCPRRFALHPYQDQIEVSYYE